MKLFKVIMYVVKYKSSGKYSSFLLKPNKVRISLQLGPRTVAGAIRFDLHLHDRSSRQHRSFIRTNRRLYSAIIECNNYINESLVVALMSVFRRRNSVRPIPVG